MTIQYGIILQATHQNKYVGDMNGEYTFPSLDTALACGYSRYQDGDEVMSLFIFDSETGDIQQHLNRKQLLNLYGEWTKEEEKTDRYSEQHALRLQDVLH